MNKFELMEKLQNKYKIVVMAEFNQKEGEGEFNPEECYGGLIRINGDLTPSTLGASFRISKAVNDMGRDVGLIIPKKYRNDVIYDFVEGKSVFLTWVY